MRMHSRNTNDQNRESPGIRLNLGCGPVQPEGWVNIDHARRAKLAHHVPWLDGLLVKLRDLPPTECNRQAQTMNVYKPFPSGTT